MKILLIDDEADLCSVAQTLLEMMGHECHIAMDGQTALSIIDNTFSLQIVDLAMPGMDGLTYIEEVSKRNLGVPIVVATGYIDVETVSRGE